MRISGAYSVTEPVSTGALTGLAKVIFLLLGSATLAAFVVMVTLQPRTRSEWGTSLICTVLSSMCGGSAVVMWLGIQHWSQDMFGLMALCGIFFSCGLPGWVVVRWIFAWLVNNPNKSPFAIVAEIREAIFKGADK